jgi:hypothetical protein
MAESPRVLLAESPVAMTRPEHRISSNVSSETGGLKSSPAPRSTLALLLDLSRELGSLLVPVQPRTEFQADLYCALVAEARRQRARQVLSLTPTNARASGGLTSASEQLVGLMHRVELASGRTNRRWIIGAAVGSASLLGLWVVVRSRRNRAAA